MVNRRLKELSARPWKRSECQTEASRSDAVFTAFKALRLLNASTRTRERQVIDLCLLREVPNEVSPPTYDRPQCEGRVLDRCDLKLFASCNRPRVTIFHRKRYIFHRARRSQLEMTKCDSQYINLSGFRLWRAAHAGLQSPRPFVGNQMECSRDFQKK